MGRRSTKKPRVPTKEELSLKYIGRRIVEFRAELNMEQKQLAEKAGISVQGLLKIEHEGPYHTVHSTMCLIAEALGLELYELYTPTWAKQCVNCCYYHNRKCLMHSKSGNGNGACRHFDNSGISSSNDSSCKHFKTCINDERMI